MITQINRDRRTCNDQPGITGFCFDVSRKLDRRAISTESSLKLCPVRNLYFVFILLSLARSLNLNCCILDWHKSDYQNKHQKKSNKVLEPMLPHKFLPPIIQFTPCQLSTLLFRFLYAIVVFPQKQLVHFNIFYGINQVFFSPILRVLSSLSRPICLPMIPQNTSYRVCFCFCEALQNRAGFPKERTPLRPIT